MKLLILGLDGATWTVIDPLIEQGRLPNLSRLIQGGTACLSKSIEPPLSPIIWTSLASGKQPSKHGVTHFFHTANNVRCRRLWDILEGPSSPIGVFAWPITWPPRPANGFIVPSLFARDHDTFPPELRFVKDLEDGMAKSWPERLRLIGAAVRHGLRLETLTRIARYAVGQMMGRYDSLDRFAEPRFVKLHIQLDICEYLFKEYNPYFASFYINQTDAFSHTFWRYYQPHLFPDTAPSQSDVERYGDMIPRAYEAADRAIGRLLRLADKDTLVAVLSDHGFEAATAPDEASDPDSVALQAPDDSPVTAGDRFQGRVRGDRLLKAMNLEHQATYVNHRQWVIIRLSPNADERRREIVDRLRQVRVIELNVPLLGITEEATGEIVCKIFARTHVYKENVDINTLHVEVPAGPDTPSSIRPFLDLVQSEYQTRFSGVHHLDGITVLNGPGVKRGARLDNSSVLDVVPTLLALLQRPVGRDMDGRVLTEAILPEFLAENPIAYVDTYDTGLELQQAQEDEEVPEELMSRLRALGYVE